MATGKVKSMYPPGNNGSRAGAGQITEDGTGKKYVFQTPADVDQASVPIIAGTAVSFDIGNGNSVGNVKLAVVAPTCTLTTSSTSVAAGGSVTLSYTSQNAESLSIEPGIGPVPIPSGDVPTPPINASTTFTLTAKNSAGTATAVVTIQLGRPM